MTVCPWCKARNPSGSQACLRCGKRAADHPSVAGRTLGDELGDENLATGPALDLDIGPVSSMRGGPASQPLGRTVDADEWGDDPQPSAKPLDLDLSAPGGDAGPAPTTSGEGDRARAAPSTAPAIEIDAYEVKALADYGPEPKSIVEAVPYALRVLRRQRDLRRALAEVRRALAEAEARRDERLVELGTLLRPVVTTDPQWASIASSLSGAEKIVQQREQALAETNADFREKAAAIDAQIAALEPTIAEATRAMEERRRAFDDADLLRKKHEARRKRVEIDVRAAQAKLARPETPPGERAQAQQLIAAAQRERETRAAEERIAVQAAQQAEAQLAQAKQALDGHTSRVDALRAQRRSLEQEFARKGAVRSEGVEAASKELRAALLEIGRKTWQRGPDVPSADVRRKSVADAEQQVRRLQVDLEKHVRALAAADRNSVRNGLVVLGAAVALVVVAFIAWRALRSNPYLPPDAQPRSSWCAPSNACRFT